MFLPILLLSLGLTALASSYGAPPPRPPVYSQNYQGGGYNRYPVGSGRPQYPPPQRGYGQPPYGGGNGQPNYEQQPYGPPQQPPSGYSYDQRPLYPEQPTYYTPYEPPYSPPTTYDPSTSQSTTTPDPDTTTTKQTTTTRGNTTTTRGTTGTTNSTTKPTGSTTTTKGSTTTTKPTSSSSTSTRPSTSTTTTKPTSTTTKKSSSTSTTTKKPSTTRRRPRPGPDKINGTDETGSGVGCAKIVAEAEVCQRNSTTVSLAVDCSVVAVPSLIKPTGVCASSCSTSKNKIVEYTFDPIKDQPNVVTAVQKGAVGLVAGCPDMKNFCTCSNTTCCTVSGAINAVTYIPHCNRGNCQNVLFIAGTGSLTCKDLNGKKPAVVIDALAQLKDSSFESKLLARGLTSVSCDGCDAINGGDVCVKL